ncbi:MAG: hypothetical protein DRN14_06365, partial [Thermoplasmata archaeon]
GKVQKVLKVNRTACQEKVIKLLNPILRGWANYYPTDCSKETFRLIEHPSVSI